MGPHILTVQPLQRRMLMQCYRVVSEPEAVSTRRHAAIQEEAHLPSIVVMLSLEILRPWHRTSLFSVRMTLTERSRVHRFDLSASTTYRSFSVRGA